MRFGCLLACFFGCAWHACVCTRLCVCSPIVCPLAAIVLPAALLFATLMQHMMPPCDTQVPVPAFRELLWEQLLAPFFCFQARFVFVCFSFFETLVLLFFILLLLPGAAQLPIQTCCMCCRVALWLTPWLTAGRATRLNICMPLLPCRRASRE